MNTKEKSGIVRSKGGNMWYLSFSTCTHTHTYSNKCKEHSLYLLADLTLHNQTLTMDTHNKSTKENNRTKNGAPEQLVPRCSPTANFAGIGRYKFNQAWLHFIQSTKSGTWYFVQVNHLIKTRTLDTTQLKVQYPNYRKKKQLLDLQPWKK